MPGWSRELNRISRAQEAITAARTELESAVVAALEAGATYAAITENTGIAASTISRYAKTRKH